MPIHGERRKSARLGLAIPSRVQGYLGDGGTWEELVTTEDVSQGGACFPLTRDVELGQILFMNLPLPKRLRQYDLQDAAYRVYTLVRSVRRRPDQNLVGVMYFGKYPPRGFHERPSARYLLPSDSQDDAAESTPPTPGPASPPQAPPRAEEPKPPTPVSEPEPQVETEPEPAFPIPQEFEKPVRDEPQAAPAPGAASGPPVTWGTQPEPERRPGVPPPPQPATPAVEFHPSREMPQDRRGAPRMQLFVNFTIQQVDEWGAVLQEELTVADNVSRGGARMMTTLGFQVGDVLLVQEAGGGFATRAEVRGVTRLQPTIERLHLKFIDRRAPDRLLRQ